MNFRRDSVNFGYYIFLLLIIFLLYLLIKKNIQYSPKKIKIYMFIVSLLFIARYIALFLLCILKSGSFVYLLKPLLFLNNLAIPLMVLALSYVYLRWDKISFNYNYVIAAAIFIVYVIEMYVIKGRVVLSPIYGYIILVKNEVILYLISLIILGILLCFLIYFFDKPNNNRWGMIYIISALIIVILENIIYIGGVRLFPYPIVGDGIFILIMNFAVNSFKRSNK